MGSVSGVRCESENLIDFFKRLEYRILMNCPKRAVFWFY